MLFGIILAVVAQASAPLQPTGKWVVEGENNMCALLHAYGEGRWPTTLGLRPWPSGDGVDLLIFTTSIFAGASDGTANVTVDAAVPISAAYHSDIMARHEIKLAIFRMSPASMEQFASAKQITISLDTRRTISFSPPDSKAALAALRNCNDMLLKSLGIDPAWADKVAVQAEPVGSPQTWFKTDDYPMTAVRTGAQGASSLLVTIAVDGRVSQCSNFGSAGNEDIDRAACDAIRKRGRYRPARDARGNPVVSYQPLITRWYIPSN
jgi:TonB family protein